MLYLAQDVVARQIEDFVKYPPRQKAASFNLDSVMEQLKPAMQAERAKETAEKQKAETARAR
jgi:arylsulfatase